MENMLDLELFLTHLLKSNSLTARVIIKQFVPHNTEKILPE